MTQDELLNKIIIAGDTSIDNALRAVVELHKEEEVTLPDGEWGILCEQCSEYGVYVFYPCKTIRAIEKELA
jgi:hypothetical protein